MNILTKRKLLLCAIWKYAQQSIVGETPKGMYQTLGTFGDTSVERNRATYDVNLTWFESADWTSTSKRRQSDVICTAFAFYVRVTKCPHRVL